MHCHVTGILSFKISDEWLYKRSEIVKGSTVWGFKMWPLAVLTSRVFFYKKMYGRFAGQKEYP